MGSILEPITEKRIFFVNKHHQFPCPQPQPYTGAEFFDDRIAELLLSIEVNGAAIVFGLGQVLFGDMRWLCFPSTRQ